MARPSLSVAWWWLVPAGAAGVTLVSDAWFVATRGLTWWRLSEWTLLATVLTGLLGLLVAAWRSPARDKSAESKLETASTVLWVSALVNYALALGLRVLGSPTSAFAWLALYLTSASSLLYLAAGWTAWRSRKLRRRRSLRVTMAPEEERVRR